MILMCINNTIILYIVFGLHIIILAIIQLALLSYEKSVSFFADLYSDRGRHLRGFF